MFGAHPFPRAGRAIIGVAGGVLIKRGELFLMPNEINGLAEMYIHARPNIPTAA
jgi:hypothetical protein